jgi:formate C-acetyltransferase
LPAWSLLTDDCIARGSDITAGGALYDFHSIALVGVPDTADALHAIERLVYAERSVTSVELLAALADDWKGHEVLRRRCLDCAKYGNDRPEVDGLAGRLAGHFIDLMDQARSPLGGRYLVHLFSFHINLPFGRGLGALPDGRQRGEPLAYSLSAHQGRDRQGVTALLASLARMPHHRAAGGSAAIVDVDPRLLAGERGEELLATLTATAFSMGVGQLQWNVVGEERLRQAQKDPDRLGHIAVRVAGYSQQFRLIPADLQEHIIHRTKHQG